jgi:hypothetical protein
VIAVVAFPIGLSLGPPPGGQAPNGRNGLAEVAAAGVNLIRTGRADWSLAQINAQISAERQTLDTLAQHGLHSWLWLGDLTNLPSQSGSPQEQQLVRIADSLQGHAALAAYKGVDEPANPLRGGGPVPVAGLVRGHTRLKQIDAAHPLVMTQAPLGTLAQLKPYAPAFDITGADIYPVSYPPGTHARTANKDISVVGDITKKLVAAAAGKPVWMTLQIAWSGVTRTKTHPDLVPRFPTLQAERFMAYQAIINGARGLLFFGGHLTEIATPDDAAAGWNWTFWNLVLRPLVQELASPELAPALNAPAPKTTTVRSDTPGIELTTRQVGSSLYLFAVRRRAGTSEVRFSGLPSRFSSGRLLFDYVQQPLPPPITSGHQTLRPVTVQNGSFQDWFALHDTHVYRFPG